MRYKMLFWMILILGLFLRLYHVWTAPYAYAQADAANIWLMSMHSACGNIPLFFYGQYYLAPVEALVTAFFFLVFGIKEATLYLGTVFFSICFIVSSYFLGRELKDKILGILLMLYAALPPVYFFQESIIPFGYHIEILFFGTIILILTLKIPQMESGIKKAVCYAVLGLIAGISFWTHYIILYYLLAAALYLLINEKWKDLFTYSVPASITFFIVGLPYWIFTFKYGFITFKFRSLVGARPIMDVFKGLFGELGYMLSLNFSGSLYGCILSAVFLCIYIFVAVLFVKILFLEGKPGSNIKNFCGFRKKISEKIKLITANGSVIIYVLVFIVIFYVKYKSTIYTGAKHDYLIPIITFVSVAFAYSCRYIFNKNKFIGVFFILAVILFNTSGIIQDIKVKKDLSKIEKDRIWSEINFLKDKGIYRFHGCEGSARMTVFFSNEEIIGVFPVESLYYPYGDIVEASEKVAFEGKGAEWAETLDNICAGYDSENYWYFNFKQHPFKCRQISPADWKAEASSNNTDTQYAFDRNYNLFWTSAEGKRDGLNYTVDLGKLYNLCKVGIYNGNRLNGYPEGCRIQISSDGMKWADVAEIKNVLLLFWSGPRLYLRLSDGRIEWYFEPVDARYIRLVHQRENEWNPWEINELFIYEYVGEETATPEDYIEEAEEITDFLIQNNIRFVYADFWMSAKIRSLSCGEVGALVPYNSLLPPRKNMDRKVLLEKNRAFLVKKDNADEIEDILVEFDLPFERKEFERDICYYFHDLEKKYEAIRSLLWCGTGLLKHNIKEYSRWLYENGEYDRALKYYKGNFPAYLKCKSKGNLPRGLFYPDNEEEIYFEHGIIFLGYSIDSNEAKPGSEINISYFWETKSELPEGIYVFVHFIKDGKVVFQNDHELLYQFPKPLNPFDGERFREDLKLNIPSGINSGDYKIIIGLWNPVKNEKICIKNDETKDIGEREIGVLKFNDN